MSRLALRRLARFGLALGSLSFVVGGVLIFLDRAVPGDNLMIFGGLALLVCALLLAATPTGDTDARR